MQQTLKLFVVVIVYV